MESTDKKNVLDKQYLQYYNTICDKKKHYFLPMLFEFPISIVGIDMGFHNPIPTSWKNFAVWGQGAALTKIMAFLGQPAFSGSVRVQKVGHLISR